MDEPPFVDTDVGRASFLLTLEDFAFFVNEFELGDAVPLEREAAGLAWEGYEVSISLAEPQTRENTAELEALGVGSLCVIAPWVPSPWGSTPWYDEAADPGALDAKRFAMERFAEAVIHAFG